MPENNLRGICILVDPVESHVSSPINARLVYFQPHAAVYRHAPQNPGVQAGEDINVSSY